MKHLAHGKTKNKSNPGDQALAGEALAEALLYLKESWGWSGADVGAVLHISASTINSWLSKKNIPVSKNISPEAQAVVHLISVHKSLAAMFSKSNHQIEWLQTEHPDFKISPLNLMKQSIESLIGLRQYLDYARGRGA